MEIKINNVQVITTLDEIKFDYLKKGDQIIQIISNKDDSLGLKFDDFNIYFVSQIKMNIISLIKSQIQHDIYLEYNEDEEDEINNNVDENKYQKSTPAIYCDYDCENSDVKFIKIGDQYIKLNFMKQLFLKGKLKKMII